MENGFGFRSHVRNTHADISGNTVEFPPPHSRPPSGSHVDAMFPEVTKKCPALPATGRDVLATTPSMSLLPEANGGSVLLPVCSSGNV